MLALAGVPILLSLVLLFCVVMFAVALAAPKRSKELQNRARSYLGTARAAAIRNTPDSTGRTPGRPFDASQKAIDRSANVGRRARRRMPF